MPLHRSRLKNPPNHGKTPMPRTKATDAFRCDLPETPDDAIKAIDAYERARWEESHGYTEEDTRAVWSRERGKSVGLLCNSLAVMAELDDCPYAKELRVHADHLLTPDDLAKLRSWGR